MLLLRLRYAHWLLRLLNHLLRSLMQRTNFLPIFTLP
jgi:hypothetical protein